MVILIEAVEQAGSLRRAELNDILFNMIKYWKGAHTKHRHMFHIVWTPKYRKRILKGTVAVRIEALLRQCAEVNRWEIHELNVQPDHVQFLWGDSFWSDGFFSESIFTDF